MADEQKIIVEIPSERGYSPISNTQSPIPDRLEQFKKGWINAIALPDNPTDLIFEITASITIPALVTSCWVSFPIPSFLRLGAMTALGVGILGIWRMLAIPEIRETLTFRLSLVGVGVLLGL